MAANIDICQAPLEVPPGAERLENLGRPHGGWRGSYIIADGLPNRKFRRIKAKQDRKASKRRSAE